MQYKQDGSFGQIGQFKYRSEPIHSIEINSGFSTKLLHQQCGEPPVARAPVAMRATDALQKRAHSFALLRVQSRLARIAFTQFGQMRTRTRTRSNPHTLHETAWRGAGDQSPSTTR